MLVLPQQVKIKWLSSNKDWFINQGYQYSRQYDEFDVSVLNLKDGSHTSVVVLCDYCQSPMIIEYRKHISNMNDEFCNKDCCNNCKPMKQKEVFMSKYGVSNWFGTEVSIKSRIHDYNYIKLGFENKGYTLISKEYHGIFHNLDYICNNHTEKGIKTTTWEKFQRGYGCVDCQYDLLSAMFSGKGNPMWKGGITPLTVKLRCALDDWRVESLKVTKGKCLISGKYGRVVHHLYSFNLILEDVVGNEFDLTNLSDEEINLLIMRLVEKHKEVGFGICLTKKIHKEFHKYYGYGNNYPEQFYEFINKYYPDKSEVVDFIKNKLLKSA